MASVVEISIGNNSLRSQWFFQWLFSAAIVTRIAQTENKYKWLQKNQHPMAWRNYSHNTISCHLFFDENNSFSAWRESVADLPDTSHTSRFSKCCHRTNSTKSVRSSRTQAEEFGRLVWCAFQKRKSYMSTGIYWQLLLVGPVQSSLIVHVCSNSARLSLMPWTLLPILVYSAQFTSTLVMHIAVNNRTKAIQTFKVRLGKVILLPRWLIGQQLLHLDVETPKS